MKVHSPTLPPLLTGLVLAGLLTASCSAGEQHRTVGGTPPAVTSAPSPALPTQAAPTPSPGITQAPTRTTYVFPISGCSVSYGHSHHDYPATDVFAARGCRVVSPVTGVVDEVSVVDRWDPRTNRGADRGGLSFSVVGADGVRYYGSHLATVLLRPGQRVAAGQGVGTVGSTGSARGTAPHLHFGISWPTRHGVWWVRRGEVHPWRYLDSWRAGGSRSPAAAVAARHRELGDVPRCSAAC